MSMNSPHESVKDIAADLWKNNRALAIALIVVIAAGLFILYRKSQASLVAPLSGDPTGTPPGGGGNSFSNAYTSITSIVQGQPAPVPGPVPRPGPGPVPIPPISGGLTGIVRPKQTSGIDKGYDASHPGGVPIRAQPSGSARVVRLAAFGSIIALLQKSLTAAANQQGGSTQWYPVAGGYISAWDLSSIK